MCLVILGLIRCVSTLNLRYIRDFMIKVSRDFFNKCMLSRQRVRCKPSTDVDVLKTWFIVSFLYTL